MLALRAVQSGLVFEKGPSQKYAKQQEKQTSIKEETPAITELSTTTTAKEEKQKPIIRRSSLVVS